MYSTYCISSGKIPSQAAVSSPNPAAVAFRTCEVRVSSLKARQVGATRTVVIPVGRGSRSLSPSGYEVPKISRNEWSRTLTHASVDLLVPSISSESSETDTQLATKSAKKAKKPRSPVQRPEPIPIVEREVVTVDEAATVLPTTANALRHKIWLASAYASLNYVGMPDIAEFAKCVRRPPGQRRVYLILPLLLAYFAGKGNGHV